jgi:uncharacterized protein HemY
MIQAAVIIILLFASCASKPVEQPPVSSDETDTVLVQEGQSADETETSENDTEKIQSETAVSSETEEIESEIPVSTEPEVTEEETVQEEIKAETDNLRMISLPVIEKKPFQDIDKEIILNMETGTYNSLKNAVTKLRKADMEYTEDEAVLLYTASSMMEILFPEQKINWQVPQASAEHSYVASVLSAKKGVYDFSSPLEDCLSCILPSLLLVTVPSVQNYYQDAETALKKALNFNSESVLARYFLGLLYNRQKRYEEAVMYLEKAYEAEKNLSVTVAYAESLLYSGNTQKAYELTKSDAGIQANSVELLYLAAVAAFNEGDFEAADSYIIQVLQREPDNGDYLLFRGRILMAKGEYIKVSSLLDAYERVKKNNKNYLLLRSQLLLVWNKNTAAAASVLTEAMNNYGTDTEVLLASASLASASSVKIAGFSAEELVSLVLASNPDNTDAMKIHVAEAVKKEQWTEAYKTSSRLVYEFKISDALIPHIKICIADKKLEEARTSIKQLSALKGAENEDVIESMIKLYIAEGKKAEAHALITKQLANAAPKAKSILYYERSRISPTEEQQLSDLRSSLTANPRNQEALYDLYLLYYNRKDYRKAQYYLNQVVALSPNDSKLLEKQEELKTLIWR